MIWEFCVVGRGEIFGHYELWGSGERRERVGMNLFFTF